MNLEAYKNLVNLYLSGDIELVEKSIQPDDTSIYASLLKIRIDIFNRKNISANKKVYCHYKKIDSYPCHVAKADILFLLARNNYYLEKPSSDLFVESAHLFFELADYDKWITCLLNACLDFIENFDLYEKKLFEVSDIVKNKKMPEENRYLMRLQMHKINFYAVNYKYENVQSLYLECLQSLGLHSLPNSDLNIFLLIAAESFLMSADTAIYESIIQKIKNPTAQIKNTVNYLEAIRLNYLGQSPINFSSDLVIDSMREVCQIYSKHIQNRLSKQEILKYDLFLNSKIFRKNSHLSKQVNSKYLSKIENLILKILSEGSRTKWEIIDAVYGESKDMSVIESQEKALRSAFWRLQNKFGIRIISFNGSYTIAYHPQISTTAKTRIDSQTDILYKRLQLGSCSFDDLTLCLYLHSSGDKTIADFKVKVSKTVSKLIQKKLISLDGDLYMLNEAKVS